MKRSIERDDSHFYYLEMKAGEILRLEAREKSTDLKCWLVRVADEKWVAHSISPFDRATLSFISEEAGWYILLVAAQGYTTGKASYEITATRNSATAEEWERLRAEVLSEESAYISEDSDLKGLLKATQQLEESLKFWTRVKDPYWEPFVHHSLGRLNFRIGEFGKALVEFNRACLLFRNARDLNGEAWSRNNLGLVHHALGDHDNAYKELDQANHLFAQLGDPYGAVTTVNNLGLVYMDIGRPETALAYYEQALPVLREFGDLRGEAAALTNIGKIYGGFGDAKKELEHSQQALQLFRRIGDQINEALTVNNIGSAYNKLGRQHEAYESFRQALPVLNAVGNKRHEAHVFGNLLNACRVLHKPRLAIFYGKQSVNRYQELRGSTTSLDKELQQNYVRSVERVYRELSELLIEQGRQAESLQLFNSFKDQQFFDLDPSSRKKVAPLALTPREAFFAELYKQKSAQAAFSGARLGSWRSSLENIKPSAEQIAETKRLDAEFKLVNDEFLTFFNQAEQEFSQQPTERDEVGAIKDLRELQNALKVLNQSTGQRTVVIYTLIGKERYSALIITSEQIFDASKPVKDAVVNHLAQQLWALLQRDIYDPRVLARQVYDLVFAPIASKLPPQTKTILWSLDGNLHYLPMAALYDGKQYLVERYNHMNFTRADSERLTRASSRQWTGLGLGSSKEQTVELLGSRHSFSALPGVEEELRAVFRAAGRAGGVLEGEVLPDEQFTQSAMLAGLGRRRPVVHIASHFSFRPGDETRSFLLLGDGSVLTLAEMKSQKDLFAGVELLTLSACNTAAQQADADGREIDAFAELAQRLGANAVMATLWPLADESSPWLMQEFYGKRQMGAGMLKAEALRRAQLALLRGSARISVSNKARQAAATDVVVITAKGQRSQTRADIVYVEAKNAPAYKRDRKKPYAHPYYWAPVILIGNLR